MTVQQALAAGYRLIPEHKPVLKVGDAVRLRHHPDIGESVVVKISTQADLDALLAEYHPASPSFRSAE